MRSFLHAPLHDCRGTRRNTHRQARVQAGCGLRLRLRAPRSSAPRSAASALITLAVLAGLGGVAAAPAYAGNRVTPGNFTGYGFDQCVAPHQRTMNRWLTHSPFLAVGIYISGDSRGCREQPNLTPRWVRTQLANGWRLLPITLGPQASCHPDFPRYGDDETIDPDPGRVGRYRPARRQARAEAAKTVAAATRLGIAAGSTLWYDLEGFDSTRTACRESALAFLSAYTLAIKRLGFRSGVYSSAGSGIRMLDDARVHRPGRFVLPDDIWIARWDGVANTSTSYIREDGWQPHRRIKQYEGGHPETWGGVTVNIDRDYLDVGRGSRAFREQHCGGVRLGYRAYPPLGPGVPVPGLTKAVQCLLKEKGYYRAPVHGFYGARVARAVGRWQRDVGLPVSSTWTSDDWVALLSQGRTPVLKIGSAGRVVRRVQRALNAAGNPRLVATGVFNPRTARAVRAWQRRVGIADTGVVAAPSWAALHRGRG